MRQSLVVNLGEAFLDEVVGRYNGTELGRQELDGELLEEAEGALWRREWIEEARVAEPATELRRTVVGIDPADGLVDGDEPGVCVAHADLNGSPYVASCRVTASTDRLAAPCGAAGHQSGRADRRREEPRRRPPDRLVERVMVEMDVRVPYREVWASTGKRTRAEPIAALYEQRKIHHIGELPDLEDQYCNWDGTGPSPGLLDAPVALTELSRSGARSTSLDAGPVVVPYASGSDGVTVPMSPGTVVCSELSSPQSDGGAIAVTAQCDRRRPRSCSRGWAVRRHCVGAGRHAAGVVIFVVRLLVAVLVPPLLVAVTVARM